MGHGPGSRRGAIVAWIALATACSSEGELPLFRWAALETRTIVETVEATGTLRGRMPRVVTAGRSGRLVAVEVEAGSEVEVGQTLGRLDPATAALDVASRRAEVQAQRGHLRQAEADLELAQRSMRRTEMLAQQRQASPAEVETAESSLRTARAAVDIAKANLQSAQSALQVAQRDASAGTIVAPMTGVVLSAPDEVGQNVGPDGPVLFQMAAPLDRLVLRAEVGEADVGRLRVGLRSTFEVQAFAGEWFEAAVKRIGVLAERDQGVATYEVILDAPNPEGRLLPGMTAAVRFEVARAEGALAARDAAVRFVPESAPPAPPRTRLFVRASERSFRTVSIETGVSDGVYTEVTAANPLAAGDEVAIGYAGDQREPNEGGGPGLSLRGKR